MFSVRRQIIDSLRTGKEYRRGFVEEKIRTGLAVQTKAIRESRPGMTQQKFAELLGKSQSWVARLENPNAPPPTITTLLKVAETFDVDLVVRYAPFSETVDWVSGSAHWVSGLSMASLAVPDFENDRLEALSSIADTHTFINDPRKTVVSIDESPMFTRWRA